MDTQGDAFFVAFPSAPQAVAAAAQATRDLAAHIWPEGAMLRVRMGLHTGTPQLVGDHYVGLDVHRAARIAATGHGGQVLLSQTTRDLVAHALPAGATLRDMGAHRLKDLQEPEPLFQMVLPDVPSLPADFPPLKTLDTYQHNLPIQPTPLLGREEQLATLSALLWRAEVRLVTLTGPGGIGKTRLAIQVAADLIEAFPDGVWFVRLSRLSDPSLVVPTIAQTLGLREQGSQPFAELLRAHLADRRLLLVLDNFEQVVGAAREVAGLLVASPGLKVLATSRLPLRLRGEKAYTVTPLPLALPGDTQAPERLTHYAAVALFIERARDARTDFAVTAANAPAIAAICAQLDGLPLAIELAAARVRVLPPEALLARLATQLKVLTGGARDLEERQQTMRATIAWSEDLLTPAERVLFRRLAVFVGGCSLEAAEAVCAAPEGAEPLDGEVLDGLSALVEQSLVQQREEDGEPRFGLLHTIREYALERLETSGEAEAQRRAHAAYFLALAERAEPQLTGPEARAWLDRLQGEHDNLRAALGWAREQAEAGQLGKDGEGDQESEGGTETGLRLAAAAWLFWLRRGHLREGRMWIEALLAAAAGPGGAASTATPAPPAPARLRARALWAGGSLAAWQGDIATATPWLEEALALARAAHDSRTAAGALTGLGILATRQGDWERADARYAEGLALMRQVGDRRGIALALNNLANVAVYQGDLERAAAAFAEALALFRQVGDRGSEAVAILNLGWVARLTSALERAWTLGREALVLFWEMREPLSCAQAFECLAATAGAAGQGARAARLLGATAALRGMHGAPQPPQERADVEQAVAAARLALGEEAWAAAFAAGHALSLEQAVAEALDEST